MSYYIDYEQTTGKILGFIIDETKKQGTLQEVTKEVFEREMNSTNNNKIVIDVENITFSKVDFTTDKEKEEQRISLINSKAGELIEAKYPIYKQLNITNLLIPYTDQDREEMRVFIDAIRKIANYSIDNGTALENIDWEI